MSVFVNITNPPAPNLPLAPEQYTRLDQSTFSNVLRLYFNQLNAMSGNLIDNQNNMNTMMWMDAGRGIFSG